jgi:phage repressor protein C with HTH and peptisase S24 domain
MKNDHSKIWTAIDRIAVQNNMSVSALAKRAGLDATAFNKSKRAYPSGKLRWLSTESLAKVIHAVDLSWAEFTELLDAASESGPYFIAA